MSLSIVVKSVHSLTASELKRCQYLTHNGEGGHRGAMLGELLHQRKLKTSKARAVILRDHRGILGWGLLWYSTYSQCKGWHLYIYIGKKHRRRGHGSKIIEKATKEAKGTLWVWPYNRTSDGFFSNHLDNKKVKAACSY